MEDVKFLNPLKAIRDVIKCSVDNSVKTGDVSSRNGQHTVINFGRIMIEIKGPPMIQQRMLH